MFKSIFARRFPYFISIVLVVFIAAAGYLVGRDQPVPLWIEQHLIPGLGWFGLILIAIVVIDWLKNVLMPKKDQP